MFAKSLRIDAPFMECPDCYGLGNRISGQGVSYYCDTCHGTGRMYFVEPKVTIMQSFRSWFHRLPKYKRINLYAMVWFSALIICVLIVIGIAEKLGW